MIRWITGDVFDGLAQLEDDSVDLVVTSPPFLALRSYLPADHPDKSKEIGSEATPAEFIDVMLRVTQELRRVLAPHGSICVELGDTYAGSGGAGGDYAENGLRAGQNRADGSARRANKFGQDPIEGSKVYTVEKAGNGWPLAKSRTLIPQLYEIALAYGANPLTGQPSPAGQWRVRNVVTWARPNPSVGALGDKWRPATSDLIVACTSPKRYWDGDPMMLASGLGSGLQNASGAPLLDYWVIPPGGYEGSHYAVFPPELVVPCVKAMCPEKVCRVCGEPARRIVAAARSDGKPPAPYDQINKLGGPWRAQVETSYETTGFTDCGHDDYRPGIVLDPFAGSGTTLAVATGHGHDAIGIDLDPRNEDLARERIGPLLFSVLD